MGVVNQVISVFTQIVIISLLDGYICLVKKRYKYDKALSGVLWWKVVVINCCVTINFFEKVASLVKEDTFVSFDFESEVSSGY
jgi:hypothetical protein